jgi:replication-associated recombination protein RarA
MSTDQIAFADRPTVGGHAVDEVVSLLQKSVRRGDEEMALWAASELDLSGWSARAFSRLRIIASEDVGLAERGIVAEVNALHDTWLDMRKAKNGADRLQLMHATLLLVRARKSRLVDHALMAFYDGERSPVIIPDYAIDGHTKRGRAMGRGADHFFDVGAQLSNVAAEVADHYVARTRAARSRPRAQRLPGGQTSMLEEQS